MISVISGTCLNIPSSPATAVSLVLTIFCLVNIGLLYSIQIVFEVGD